MALTERQIELKLCPIGFELVQEEHPVEASRSGCNTVFHYCDPQGIRASYAGCLHTMTAVAEGRGYLRPDCEIAINNKTCPARALRIEELQAERALYFVDYIELTRRRKVIDDMRAEQSPIQFRRRGRETLPFKPTKVAPLAARDTIKQAKPVIEPEPESIMDMDIGSNIMEQVLKKRMEQE